MAAIMASRRPGYAFHRELQQLGHGFEIPVRVGRVHVSEIGRQFRQLTLDIEAGPVPPDQGLCGESMPEILNTGPMPVATVDGRRPQPHPA